MCHCQIMEQFGIGWGNRLQRQIEDYVPVVLAAGGSLGEATDYILALKILRKTRNRYGYTPQHFEDLRKFLEQAWSDLRDERYLTPGKSLQIIKAEIRQKQPPGRG